jgi:hypothetical protein
VGKSDSDILKETIGQKAQAELHILLSDVLLSFSNAAAEFVDVFEDDILLKINLLDDQGETILEVDDHQKVNINKGAGKNNERIHLINDFEAISIAIQTDDMMKAWMGDVSIEVHNRLSAYIKYHVVSAKANLQWYEMQAGKKGPQFLSEITKTVKPLDDVENDEYSLRDVEICAEMLGKAIRRIDLRTGGAMVKFNTDHGRLEPILRTLATHLGYVLKRLNPDEIYELHRQDINASHSIRLKS